MLTSLRFKNWRSLKDVEINDLTPITVFVGANSSGKTNIFDGLRFMRSALDRGFIEAAFSWNRVYQIHTLDAPYSEPTEIEFKTEGISESGSFSYEVGLDYNEDMSLAVSGESLAGGKPINESRLPLAKKLTSRWQVLNEDFMPPARVSVNTLVDMSLRLIDTGAQNVPAMLDFMRQTNPAEFEELKEDLAWLLKHVRELTTVTTDRDMRISIFEKQNPEVEAPTISAGTLRVVAMLTAMRVLNTFEPELPGLVAFEAPDMAVHPLLLDSLVELFRVYVDVDEDGIYNGDGTNRRQVFLTTQNPRLLDYFKPHEVRLVERDESGITTVKPVPLERAKIWLDDYGLGTAWVTRSLGGVPE